MIKVFLDSSVVFKLIKIFIEQGSCRNSKLLQLNGYQFIISDVVIAEVAINIKEKYHHDIYPYLKLFLQHTNIKLIICDTTNYQIYLHTVSDPNDVMIVYHAIQTQSQILLTANIKDFRTTIIEQKFGVKVAEYLSSIL